MVLKTSEESRAYDIALLSYGFALLFYKGYPVFRMLNIFLLKELFESGELQG